MSQSLFDTIVGGIIGSLLLAFILFLMKPSTRFKIFSWFVNMFEQVFKKKMRFNSADFLIPATRYKEAENLIILMNQDPRSKAFKKFNSSKFKGLQWALRRSGFKTKESPEGIRIIGSKKFKRIDGIFDHRVEEGRVPIQLLISINSVTGQLNNRIEFYRFLKHKGIDILGLKGNSSYALKSENSYRPIQNYNNSGESFKKQRQNIREVIEEIVENNQFEDWSDLLKKSHIRHAIHTLTGDIFIPEEPTEYFLKVKYIIIGPEGVHDRHGLVEESKEIGSMGIIEKDLEWID